MSTKEFGRLTVDVFGRRLVLLRGDRGWEAYDVGSDGKRSPIDDIAIPQTCSESELLSYLDALFHDRATEKHPEVRIVERIK